MTGILNLSGLHELDLKELEFDTCKFTHYCPVK